MNDFAWVEFIAIAENPLGQLVTFGICCLAGLAVGRLLQTLQGFVDKQFRARGKEFAALIYCASVRPISYLALIVGMAIGLQLMTLPPRLYGIVVKCIATLSVVTVAWLCYRLVDVVDVWLKRRSSSSASRVGDMLAPLVSKSLRIGIVLLAVLQALQMFSNQSVTTLLAGLGVGGLALALASQETVKNLFGSMVILGDKPFELGDRIVVDGHDGTVETVGFRSTRIRTLTGDLVTVPNGELANKTIQNVGKRPNIRYLGNITVPYNTSPAKISEALAILRQLLDNHEGMRADTPPRVHFSALNSDSLNLQVLFWYHPPDNWNYLAFCERFHLAVMDRFNAAGIEFAFPTQTVYVRREN